MPTVSVAQARSDKAREVVRLRTEGTPRKRIAQILGCSVGNVYDVLRGNSWCHATGILPGTNPFRQGPRKRRDSEGSHRAAKIAFLGSCGWDRDEISQFLELPGDMVQRVLTGQSWGRVADGYLAAYTPPFEVHRKAEVLKTQENLCSS